MSNFDIGFLNNSYTLTDSLNLTSRDDTYSFKLNDTRNLKLSLLGLSTVVDWQLKDNGGTILYNSSVSPTSTEAINLSNLIVGDYSLQVSQTGSVTDYTLKIDSVTGLNLESGFFTVGQTGEVGVDYLIDGGGYQGELAIFSLTGIEAFAAGSELFIKEVARRSLSNSTEGYIAIQDATEGAKFSPTFPWGDNQNSGEYKNIKKFTMKPGDKFGFMLVPNGTVQEVFNNPNIGGAKRPLFSVVTANPNEAFHVGQIADVTGDGKTFVMEDKRVDAGSDKDYNDLVFRVTGATGKAVKLDDVIDPGKDWRKTDVVTPLIEYINTPPKLEFNINPIYKVGESINLNEAKVFDENGDLDEIKIEIRKNNQIIDGKFINAADVNYDEDWAKFNYSWMPAESGEYELKAIALDKNNQKDEITRTFRVDVINEAPTNLQFTLPQNSYQVGDNVTLANTKIFDTNGWSDLKLIDFWLEKDDGSKQELDDVNTFINTNVTDNRWATFTYSFLPNLGAGSYQLKARAFDKSGLLTEAIPQNFTVFNKLETPKNTSPEFLQFNILPSYTSGKLINLTNTKVYDKDGYEDLKEVKFQLYKDGAVWGSQTSAIISPDPQSGQEWGTFNYSWNDLPVGDYRLEAIAYDTTQSSTPVSKTFSVFNQPVEPAPNSPPQFLQLNLLPSYTVGQTVTFANAKLYDKNGESDLENVTLELYKDNKFLANYNIGIVDDSNPGDGWGTFNISFNELALGNYEVKAIAFDKSGATDTDTANFTINLPPNKPPEDLRFNTLPLYTNAETISFDGARVSDPDGVGDLTKVDFWLQHPDGRWVDITDVTSEQFTTDSKGRARFGYNYDLSGLAPGRYQLRAIAQDKAGNFSIPETQTFSVITDPGGTGLSDEVRLAMVEAANLESYDPQALAQTREWVVWVTPGKSSSELAALLGAENLGATGQIPNTYIWKFADNISPQDVANLLGTVNGVEFAYPQVPVEIQLLYQPQDTLFPAQWNLTNTKVPTAWDTIGSFTSQPVRGRNTVIGIVDDGIAYNHKDLQSRYNSALSWDFTDNDSDPAPGSNKIFKGDTSSPKLDDPFFPLNITFEMPVSLTGIVTDVNVTLNVNNFLDRDLPNPTDLSIFLYSPDESAFNPGNWGNSTSPSRFPGRDDLKFQQKVQLFIQPDGSVLFDKSKLTGCYAGGTWKLEIENPDVDYYLDFGQKETCFAST